MSNGFGTKSKMTNEEDATRLQAAAEQAAVHPHTPITTLDLRPPPTALSEIHRMLQNLSTIASATGQERAEAREKVVYEKEKLLSIVAKRGELLKRREARLVGRERDLEVALIARWGANMQDLKMLEAEKQQRGQWDLECENEGGD
jgi:hypothetical protein